MDVRHALADSIVHRVEEPVGLHPHLDGAREALHMAEESASQLGREIENSLVMAPRDQQAMAREQWTMIEEGQEVGVLEDQVSGELARGYPAERALGDGHRGVLP